MTERPHPHDADDATLAYLARQEEAVRWLGAEIDRLRATLRELYEAAHDHLNVVDDTGLMAEGTPRLNAALGRAFEALGGDPAPSAPALGEYSLTRGPAGTRRAAGGRRRPRGAGATSAKDRPSRQ